MSQQPFDKNSICAMIDMAAEEFNLVDVMSNSELLDICGTTSRNFTVVTESCGCADMVIVEVAVSFLYRFPR